MHTDKQAQGTEWVTLNTFNEMKRQRDDLLALVRRAQAIRTPNVKWTRAETARSWAEWDIRAAASAILARSDGRQIARDAAKREYATQEIEIREGRKY